MELNSTHCKAIFDSILEYIKDLVRVQNLLITYIDEDENENENYTDLTNYIQSSKILEDKDKAKSFFHLLSCIFNNHHRKASFLRKIDQLTNQYKKDLFKHFSEDVILDLFRANKRFALSIFGDPQNNEKLNPELIKKLHYSNDKKDTEEEFEKKIRDGENDELLQEYIRKDEIEQFVTLLTQKAVNVNHIINRSQFESHSYLNDNSVSLIEYAAFFGSIQIFHNLKYSDAKLSQNLWPTVIHGRNNDLVHILEENKIDLPNDGYVSVAQEAIRCHHNEYVDYIKNNLYDDETLNSINTEQKALYAAFEAYNFEIMDQQLQVENIVLDQNIFRILLENDYYYILKILIDSKKFNVNSNLGGIFFYLFFFMTKKVRITRHLCILPLLEEVVKLCSYF